MKKLKALGSSLYRDEQKKINLLTITCYITLHPLKISYIYY